MKIVYVAGPFSGDGSKEAKAENVAAAKSEINKLIEADIPYYSPHLNIEGELIDMDDTKKDLVWNLNGEMLKRTDIMAVLPGWKNSAGTREEIKNAEIQGKEVIYLDAPDAIDRLKTLTK